MSKFEIIIKIVAALSTVVTFAGIFITIEKVTLKDFLSNKFTKWAIPLLILGLFVYLFPWDKLHYGENKQLIIHDTIKISTPNLAYYKPKDSNYNQAVSKKRTIVYKPNKQYSASQSDKKDTSSKGKYVFTAPISQSAIGDNSSVTVNNNGIKQRHVNEQELNKIISWAIKILNTHPELENKIDLTSCQDAESLNLAREVMRILIEHKFSAIYNPGFSAAPATKTINMTAEFPGMNAWPEIDILPASNVQE